MNKKQRKAKRMARKRTLNSVQWNTPEARAETLRKLDEGRRAYWSPERRAAFAEKMRQFHAARRAAGDPADA